MESKERKLQIAATLRQVATELEAGELLSVETFAWLDEIGFVRKQGFASTGERVFRIEFRYRTSDGSEPASE